ncbi:MAG: hypothetical protein ACR2RA_08380 [Geminicoccaceae bacterium]
MTDVTYFPSDMGYSVSSGNIYATYRRVRYPERCRKYHISSNIPSAPVIAETVLPYLREQQVGHKVVRNQSFLVRQTMGKQAGKFITIYMNSGVDQMNPVISTIRDMLVDLRTRHPIGPCPWLPRYRPLKHIFIEQPLDEHLFIYGGFEADTFGKKTS